MGYLSQKKRQANIKETLLFSLIFMGGCCVLLLLFKDSETAFFVSKGLFHIYLYMLSVVLLAFFYHFYWQGCLLLLGSFILFLNLGMGCNLFVNVKTPGLQTLKILYQPNVSHLHETEKRIVKQNADITGITQNRPSTEQKLLYHLNLSSHMNDKNLILTPHKIVRSGEILLSQSNQAGFAEINLNLAKLVFISLDFSKSSSSEIRIALKNLAEFVKMQDFPVIVVGNFGLEAWSPDFIDFMESTGLEVKNRVIMSDAKSYFNPFVTPAINVLAYKDFGIRNLRFLPKKKNGYHPLLIELNY